MRHYLSEPAGIVVDIVCVGKRTRLALVLSDQPQLFGDSSAACGLDGLEWC